MMYAFDLKELLDRLNRVRDIDNLALKVSSDDREIVLTLTRDPNLPLSVPVDQNRFFIRTCYPVYYDLLMECLYSGTMDFLSVTGTPGIGKSVFYIYVFNRYRKEHPKNTIITASFDRDNMLIECVVYKPGKEPQFHDFIPDMDGLYLFDGPPAQAPIRKKMICFTSPNLRWFKKNCLNRRHSQIFMPVWTLEELIEAGGMCGLNVSQESITERFHHFGGCPRYCLCEIPADVISGEQALAGKLDMIDSYDKIAQCLKESTPEDQITHQVFHSSPVLSDTFPFVQNRMRFICSKKARELIYHAIKDKSALARAELIRSIRMVPELGSLRGQMFEDFCEFKLSKGGTFTIVSLDHAESTTHPLNIGKGEYNHMDTGCESVDGVFFPEDGTLYLLQITVGKKHPVNAHELLERIKSVGMFDDFCTGKAQVKLVFVLPRNNHEFKKQNIEIPRKVDWESPVCVMGLRQEFLTELGRLQIETADDLRQGVRNGLLSAERYTSYVEKFEARVINAPYYHLTKLIPQFMFVLDECEEPDEVQNMEIARLRAENERLKKRLQDLESLATGSSTSLPGA